MLPSVATGHQTEKREETGNYLKLDGGKPQASCYG